jgi:hypothetical protein
MRRFDLKKINDGGVKKLFQVEISKTFRAWEYLDVNEDIYVALET